MAARPVKGHGEAGSATVVVDTASVAGFCRGGDVRVGDRRVVSLICAGWLPQDGVSAGERLRGLDIERVPSVISRAGCS
jgi:hypothetical protein